VKEFAVKPWFYDILLSIGKVIEQGKMYARNEVEIYGSDDDKEKGNVK
jgi:hypothetical protein